MSEIDETTKPDPVSQEKEYTPLQSINEQSGKSPEEQLKERSVEMIRSLDKKNQEAISQGNNRLGYKMGTGEHEMFILGEPANEEIDSNHPDTNKLYKSLYRHYVVFTPEGVRAITFNKGVLDDSGKLETENGVTFDERYDGGEKRFLSYLTEHAQEWEDASGKIRESYTRPLITDPSRTITLPYNLQVYGYFRPRKINEKEEMIVGHDLGGAFRAYSDEYPPARSMSTSVKEITVKNAFSKSLESSHKKAEVKITPAQQQVSLIDSLLTQL